MSATADVTGTGKIKYFKEVGLSLTSFVLWLVFMEKIKKVFYSFALIAVAGICVNVSNILTIFIPFKNKYSLNLMLLVLFGIIGFIVIPYFLSKFLEYIKQPVYINLKQAILLFLIIFFYGVGIHSTELWHDFVIAVCEEFLFRYVIFQVLQSNNTFNKLSSVVLGSLLFALVLHINGSFLVNLLTKFPMSLIMYFLADRFGLQSSIAFHWVYNVTVGKLF